MSNKYPNLFSPIKIGNCEVKNRIAMMPMGNFAKRMMHPDGSYTKDGADYYIERAKGGTGLIITGLVPIVSWLGLPHILANPEAYVEHQKYLAEGCHKYGAKVFIQMTAISGRSSVHPGDPAPSVMPMVWDPTKTTREMTVEEIHQYVENFAEGAYLAQQAGIDGVEVHAVHEGYLIDQFTISAFNHRTDEYGGSLENRLRFPIEIVQAIKAKCGKDYPVSLRYSVKSYVKDFNRGALPGEDYKEFGRDMDESLIVAKMLVEAGYDMLNCDNGTYDSWYWAHPPVYMPKACNLEDVARIAEVVDVPVVCAGKFDDPNVAEKAIAEGKCDMMGLGRPLLADENFANKVAEGNEEDIRPCIGCHMGCLSRIFQPPFKDISCALNPRCGLEKQLELKEVETKKKIAVVGGGIGGMEAAILCAKRGHQVTLYEKTDQLGGVFIAAAAPSFKEKDRALIAWYIRELAKYPIDVHKNTEVGDISTIDADEIIVATGATAKKLPVKGAETAVEAVDYLLGNKTVGENVVVVGGGLTGCEIAYDLYLNGKNPTIVEAQDDLITTPGVCLANTSYLRDFFKTNQVSVHLETSLCEINNGNVTLKNKEGEVFTVNADSVILSVGYNPAPLVSKGKHVHVVGDAKNVGNLRSVIWGVWNTCMKL